MAEPLDGIHARPEGVDDATVAAVGRVSEAMEYVERARGRLFDFHQLSGRADLLFGDAADALEEAGHSALADRLRGDVIGRNVVPGRWTFQLVEEYGDGYYAAAAAAERQVRESLLQGRRHVYEAEMKQRRRSAGRPGHDATPADAKSSSAPPASPSGPVQPSES